MHYDRLSFTESIQELANTHGIKITQYINNKQTHTKHNNLYQLMNNLCIYYKNNLMHKKHIYAYNYLQNRGLNKEMVLKFDIGFAPIEWNNILKQFGVTLYDQNLLSQSGMLINNIKHKYDRFRNRIMFPIKNISGQIVAFGGRILTKQKTPKYLNSSDTKIFKKSQHLYGLYETYSKYKHVSSIILVEGYIDVITLTQFGINYAVASLGTSITKHHIQSLYNITDKIICCYDGDYAGRQAAWRTLQIALPYLTDDRQIHFMFLPEGEDPDTLIRKIGKNNFLKKLTQTKNLSYFLFNTLLHDMNLQTLEDRIKLSNIILPMIEKIPGKTLRLCLLQELGNKIGILDENKLNQLITTNKHKSTNTCKKCFINYKIEHILIGLLIQNPKLVQFIPTTQGLNQYAQNDIMIFIDLIHTCKTYAISTSAQLLEHYRNNKFFSKLETLAYWNHLITNDMIEITFIEILTKLYNLILEKRQTILIYKDRVSKLTKKERLELWLINKTLSIKLH